LRGLGRKGGAVDLAAVMQGFGHEGRKIALGGFGAFWRSGLDESHGLLIGLAADGDEQRGARDLLCCSGLDLLLSGVGGSNVRSAARPLV
jgi:hypothetical protein